MSNIIELSNISKSFTVKKNLKVLKKINFKFKRGKVYSLMGPSGSGKSTLLNLISLVDRPTSGSVTFDNKKINFNENEKNDLFRANKIGIIYQQDNLLSDFTALENIYFASLAAGFSKDIAVRKAKIILNSKDFCSPVEHKSAFNFFLLSKKEIWSILGLKIFFFI